MSSFDIVVVTNRHLCCENFLTRIQRLAAAGIDGLILREKDLDKDAYRLLARRVMAICLQYDVSCFLHTHIDVAQQLHCPNIHLPFALFESNAFDLSAFSQISVSVHAQHEAKKAEGLGASRVVAGHVFETDCKKNIPGRGIDFLREVCENTSLPVYAIGGITPQNAVQLVATGVRGLCFMSSMMAASHPEKYIRQLKHPQIHI